MVTPLKVDGADVSHHQTDLDLQAAEAGGLGFLYHKATEGTHYFDTTYLARRNAAAKVSLPFGAYHFAHPAKGTAADEAKYFLDHATPKPGDLIPVLDLEVNEHNLSRAELTTWVGTFCHHVFKATGFHPIIYTSFDLDHNFGSMLWQPRYNNSNMPPEAPEPWKRWDIWQFSNGEYGVPNRFAGLGHVDLNHLRDGLNVDHLVMHEAKETKDHKNRTGKFRIMTQNIQGLPLHPQNEVEDDVALTAKQAGVIGFQEIIVERYDKAVEALEKSGKWEVYWGQGGVNKTPDPGDSNEPRPYDSPVAWRTKYWEFVKGGKFKIAEGLAKVQHPRWGTWVLLRHKNTGALVYFVNFHMIADAWNKKHVAHKAERPKLWREEWNLILDQAAQLIDEEPDAALAMLGDFNASFRDKDVAWGDLKIGPRKIQVTFEAAIDHVLLVNGRRFKWQIDGEHTCGGRNSDHRGRQLEARLTW